MRGKFIETAILKPASVFRKEMLVITNTHNIAHKSQKFNSAATALDMKPVQSTLLIMACGSLQSELKQFML
jgi:hypothetical protein